MEEAVPWISHPHCPARLPRVSPLSREGGPVAGCPLHTRWVQCGAGRLLPPILPIPWEWSPSLCPSSHPHPRGVGQGPAQPRHGETESGAGSSPNSIYAGGSLELILHPQAPRSPAYPAGKGCGCLGLRKWERPGRNPALLLPQPHLPGPLNIPRASRAATSASPARCPG